MKNAFVFLYELEKAVPPDAGQHHSLELRAEGSKSKPTIVIRRPVGRVTVIYLEGADIERSPEVVVGHVVAFLGELG